MKKDSRGRVLVTGGAGYIGSHVTLALQAAGRPAVVLDNLSTGDARAVPTGVPLQIGEAADRHLVARLIEHYRVTVIIHLAGSIIVPELLREPIAYYHNNTEASRALIGAGTEGQEFDISYSLRRPRCTVSRRGCPSPRMRRPSRSTRTVGRS